MTPKNAAILARIAFIQGTQPHTCATSSALHCYLIPADAIEELVDGDFIKPMTPTRTAFALTPAGWQVISNAVIDAALEGGDA